MSEPDGEFKDKVYEFVRQIPKGRVMTYGQLAALAGHPYAARIVGGIAHFGDPDLPWQRVVNKQGGLASGYPGGKAAHQAHLEAEGVEVDDEYKVKVNELLWWPPEKDPTQNQTSLLS
jgi:methylated-DNA-protein-cysteine methyltransferase-like protein